MSQGLPGVVVVAGSDRMNHQVAEILQRDGCTVVHVREHEADDAPEHLPSIVHPFADFTSAQGLMGVVEAEFGPIAGLVTPLLCTTSRGIRDVDAQGWATFLDSGIKRNVALARAAAISMAGRSGGRVVVLSATSSFFGDGIEQAAAQAAMISLANAITLSMEPSEVAANCVVTGDGADRGGLMVDRPTSGDMLGAVVSYLLGDQGREVSGQLIACSGNSVGLYVPPLIIESTNVLVRFEQTPTAEQLGSALEPLLNVGRA